MVCLTLVLKDMNVSHTLRVYELVDITNIKPLEKLDIRIHMGHETRGYKTEDEAGVGEEMITKGGKNYCILTSSVLVFLDLKQ